MSKEVNNMKDLALSLENLNSPMPHKTWTMTIELMD